MVSCTDWAIKTEFVNSWPFLWLNYHTVHHLFPLIDFSHHRDVQAIIMETCRDHGLTYEAGDFFELYRQMIHSFSTPSSLLMTINAYNGS
jgi:fatty acid desaturase